MATVQVTSALIAALQVEHAVKCLHGRAQRNGVRMQYDGGGAQPYFEATPIFRRRGCECEEMSPLPEVAELEGAAAKTSLRDCLTALEKFGVVEPAVKFPGSFVSHLFCGKCNQETTLLQPIFRLRHEHVQCPNCRIIGDRASLQLMMLGDSWEVMSLDMSAYREAILNLSLQDLGFPRMAIFQVQDGQGRVFDFELSQDEEATLPGLSKARKRTPAAGKVAAASQSGEVCA
jgi:hypothetical protein